MMEGYSRHPYFLAKRPNTYEETVNAVREFVDGVAAMRRDGELPDSASGLVVVDSLRKLVPEDIIAKIKRFGAQGEKGSVDGMGGRAAQIKAAMHAAWLDELTPRLYPAPHACGRRHPRDQGRDERRQGRAAPLGRHVQGRRRRGHHLRREPRPARHAQRLGYAAA